VDSELAVVQVAVREADHSSRRGLQLGPGPYDMTDAFAALCASGADVYDPGNLRQPSRHFPGYGTVRRASVLPPGVQRIGNPQALRTADPCVAYVPAGLRIPADAPLSVGCTVAADLNELDNLLVRTGLRAIPLARWRTYAAVKLVT